MLDEAVGLKNGVGKQKFQKRRDILGKKKNLKKRKKNFMAPFFFMDGVQLPQG